MMVTMKSVLQLAKYVFTKQVLSYFLTYKLSQDHLETFFACVRRMGGHNNNPSCRQFRSSYKKLLTHVNAIVPDGANCTSQDETNVLKVQKVFETNVSQVQQMSELTCNESTLLVNLEHDYSTCNNWCWNEYNSEVVMYIASAVVRSLRKTLKCDICIECLENDVIYSDLQNIKNRIPTLQNVKDRNGLLSLSADVINICKTAEKVLRGTKHLLSTKNILLKLIISAKHLLLSSDLFTKLNVLIETSVIDNHRNELLSNILKKYFHIRLHHESRTLTDNVKRIRSFHNRLVIFKNQ